MIENARLREIATRDEGRYEGRKEGLLEEQERITINLLKSGMSLGQIKKMTGLSLAKLRELDRKIKD